MCLAVLGRRLEIMKSLFKGRCLRLQLITLGIELLLHFGGVCLHETKRALIVRASFNTVLALCRCYMYVCQERTIFLCPRKQASLSGW